MVSSWTSTLARGVGGVGGVGVGGGLSKVDACGQGRLKLLFYEDADDAPLGCIYYLTISYNTIPPS